MGSVGCIALYLEESERYAINTSFVLSLLSYVAAIYLGSIL